jgi:hypothetical protein
MPVILKQTKTDFKPLEPGTYIARCIGMWDIGRQESTYDNQTIVRQQVILQWEVPDETSDDGKPMTISAFYTASLHEKSNLYKTLIAWRGRNFTEQELAGFELETIVGAPCLLTVVHSDAGRARVGAVAKLGKGMACGDAVHPLSTDPGAEIPEWVQKHIDNSVDNSPQTYKPAETGDAPSGAEGEADDDLPF